MTKAELIAENEALKAAAKGYSLPEMPEFELPEVTVRDGVIATVGVAAGAAIAWAVDTFL